VTVVITGAAGTIGTALAAALTDEAIPIRLLDIRPHHHAPANTQTLRVDLRDLPATIKATVGASVLIHLAGITEEAPFPEICEHNILGTYHVLEAARRHHIPRVVLASSHHTIGFTPISHQITTTSATAPDSFYAVSKITGEALGSLYAHKHHLTVVAIRIGSVRPTPTEPRHTATWLSPRDSVTLLRSAATQPLTQPFLTVYGTSDNPWRWWPRDGWDQLDYHPTDRADDHPTLGPLTDHWHGGTYPTNPSPNQDPSTGHPADPALEW
jgi:uronate dehydrogenase